MTLAIEQIAVPGLVVLTPARFGDERGWFCETWNAEAMAGAGLDLPWRQDNHAFSASKGTLRGLHYQAPPRAQDKLVRCSRGAVLDVAVDIRVDSPTFGRSVVVELSAENGRQLLIPQGFLHGYATLTDNTEVQYKCTDTYAPETGRSVRWDDPDLAIPWGLAEPPILSPKDAAAPLLRDAPSPFVWQEEA